MYVKDYIVNRGMFNSEIQLTVIPESRYEEITLCDRLHDPNFLNMVPNCAYIPRNKGSFKIKKVIFNNPATIVYWEDGTKTVVKCGKDDTFDAEKGLALCFMKKALGNKGNFNNTIKEHVK